MAVFTIVIIDEDSTIKILVVTPENLNLSSLTNEYLIINILTAYFLF